MSVVVKCIVVYCSVQETAGRARGRRPWRIDEETETNSHFYTTGGQRLRWVHIISKLSEFEFVQHNSRYSGAQV